MAGAASKRPSTSRYHRDDDDEVARGALLWELPQNLLGALNASALFALRRIANVRFGPLYLPLVGVPSTMRVFYAVAHRVVTGRRWGGYYDAWPERSADELGGVDRSLRPLP